jgi:hypothetical protein
MYAFVIFLQTMKSSYQARLDNFTCDFSRCQQSLLRFSPLDELVGGARAAAVREHASAACKAVKSAGALYARHVSSLYRLHLEAHVEALMQSPRVLKFIDHFEFVEGKVHVFLYYVWKDTPRVVVKITREVRYLGYFLHWRGTQAVASLAVAAHRGLSSAGLRGAVLELELLESLIYLLGAALLLLCLVSFKQRVWSCVAGVAWALCLLLLLCPYWIVTKPFRMVYRLLCT